ncbi:flagellar basal body rod protein FlgC [Hyphomicrobium sp. LHD-15]|uniref:flagellar basal body rod protein FlgC n=1 Tax=Hyphomicrobium sp. LHD-15 TaxID=3072142 RepID=UPI00281021AD|nr:flagellar basal body rod protein FlgC [Hyphomicrobium sp. LHD-15]MDQ8699081.1 flagellar basal body rod protein FlgC [Hyphomicrobium sp. LHD-15]
MADPMQVAIKVAASGLEAQSRRMLVVSENLANASSTGSTPGANPYTRQTVSFESALDDVSGANLVQVDRVDTDKKPYRIEYDPSHPAADEQGNVKLPNVDMLVELADMRETNRSYEANLQVVKQARSLISMTIDLLRSS